MTKAFPIKNFPGYYITDTGDVYSRIERNGWRFKKLKPTKLNTGYLQVGLFKNKKRKFITVHRLVAEAFIPNPKNKRTVNHINGIHDDNHVKNLEWATDSENNLHAFRVLKRKPTWLNKSGDKNPNSKIVLQIKNGIIVAEFCGASEAARQIHIDVRNISAACLGKRKSAGGFQWKYK